MECGSTWGKVNACITFMQQKSIQIKDVNKSPCMK